MKSSNQVSSLSTPKIKTIGQLDKIVYDYFSSINVKQTNYIDILKELQSILTRYDGDDWERFTLSDSKSEYLKCVYPSSYTQQLYAIIIISWKKNKYIKIHDHADNGCTFKVLEGSLTETIYDNKLNKLHTNNLMTGSVTSLHNKIGYHSITTNDSKSYSLHIYSPYNYKTNFLE